MNAACTPSNVSVSLARMALLVAALAQAACAGSAPSDRAGGEGGSQDEGAGGEGGSPGGDDSAGGEPGAPPDEGGGGETASGGSGGNGSTGGAGAGGSAEAGAGGSGAAAGGSVAQGGMAGTPSQNVTGGAPGAPDSPPRLMMWDGDTARGGFVEWVFSGKQGKGVATAAVSRAEAHNGSFSFHFFSNTPDWQGFGYNLAVGGSVTGGHNLTRYTTFSFWLKTVGTCPPIPIALRTLPGSNSSVPVNADRYATITPGQWSKVVIPLGDIKPQKAEFTLANVGEIEMVMNSAGHSCDVYFDEFGAN